MQRLITYMLVFMLLLTGCFPEQSAPDETAAPSASMFITRAEALEAAKQIDPEADWDVKFMEEYLDPDKGQRSVWMAVAEYAEGNRTVVYVDAKSGEPITVSEMEAPLRKAYRPHQLKHIKGIKISKALAQKTTTDTKRILPVVSALEKAAFVKAVREDREAGEEIAEKTGYLIEMRFENGEKATLSYDPRQDQDRFWDIEKQEWWSAEGLHQAIQPLLPPEYLPREQMLQIVQNEYEEADFSHEHGLRLIPKEEFDVFGDHVWFAVGITPKEEKVSLHIDPVSGRILRKGERESTQLAVETVRTFGERIENKEYDKAWEMIHSKAKMPYPGVDTETIKREFLSYWKKGSPVIKEVHDAQWEPVWGKIPECMCWLDDAVKVEVELSNGEKQSLHAVKDEDNEWKLFWSYNGFLK